MPVREALRERDRQREVEIDAQAAVRGDHYETGEKRLQQRVRVKKF